MNRSTLSKCLVRLLSACAYCALLACPMLAQAGPSANEDEGKWISMPEGGHPSFVGVQGGTVPASVYYNEDGSATTQAGLGSNDFLEAVQGDEQNLTADNLIPFGYLEEASAMNNLASRGSQPLPRILPDNVTKIYEQVPENDLPLLVNELPRI